MGRQLHSRLLAAGRWAVGALLLWAAIPKVWRPEEFAWTVARYEFTEPPWTAVVAIVVPWLEAVVAVSLLAPVPWRRGAWLMGAVLFAAFCVAIALVVARGLHIPCGCFGDWGRAPAGPGHAVLNAALAAICFAAALRRGTACPAP